MPQATLLWSLWQRLLQPFAWAFTRPGHRRFVEWVTALALNVEEHTITQSVTAIERLADWKAMERFAEYGAWDAAAITRNLTRSVEQAPGRIWHGYHICAVDDTKVHRSGEHVWGTCTFHEYTARCPNRAATVRAHNWVVLGALLQNPDQPAWFLPLSGRLSFRQSQLPARSGATGPKEEFRTKCELVVELIREQARLLGGPHLAVCDGGYALTSVVGPLVAPEGDRPRIEFLTRLRHDARLYALPPQERRPGQRGPTPKWGRKLPPPRQGGRWTRGWQEGHAFIYGRRRKVFWKEVVCLWWVSGHQVPVKAVVAKVEGYKQRFMLVSSAIGLTGLQMVELFAARFRQEDGFRDLKQRLGWEECRAWTRNPIERTTQAQWVTMSLLRLLQFRLDEQGCPDWWSPPPWDKKEERPSVLDVERLLRRHRPEIQRLLSEWLRDEEEAA
ncbi:MAG TPA: transposase [Isosphaeraceae bacterium]|nr:transposase [Isosphaeraceae bacterium]